MSKFNELRKMYERQSQQITEKIVITEKISTPEIPQSQQIEPNDIKLLISQIPIQRFDYKTTVFLTEEDYLMVKRILYKLQQRNRKMTFRQLIHIMIQKAGSEIEKFLDGQS